VKTANFAFNIGLFSWLSYGEFPVDTSRPDPKDDRLNVSSETVNRLNILFVWVLPGILLALGTILLIRRKRK
jgi:ABC-2 type transport system permease protein